jgi:hypothetical protein
MTVVRRIVTTGSAFPPDQQLVNTTPVIQPASVPAYLTPFTQASWPAVKHTRVSNVVGQRNAYSRTAGWNSDDSRILLGSTTAPACILDGTTYQKLHDLPFLVGMHQWANTNPNRIYGTWYEENHLRYQTADANATLSIQHTFTGYTSISLGDNEGGISDDDNTFALMYVDAAGNNGVLVYDRQLDTIVATRSFGSQRPDTAFISRSGNYVMVYWSATVTGDGPGANQGLWLYDRNLNVIRQVTQWARHGDPARLADGTEVWAQVAFGGEYYRLDNGAQAYIFGTGKPYPYNNAFTLGHLSGRATGRNGWVYMSNYNYPSTNTAALAYGRDQIVAAKLDTTGTCEVFGWSNHRNDGQSSNAMYYSCPFATPSRDGTKVLWGSEWGDPTEPYETLYAYVSEAA